LKESLIGYRDGSADLSKPVDKYLQDLETDMHNVKRYAQEHACDVQQKYAQYYNARAKDVFSDW